jgi:ABC-type multidrug transport system fused ATPase/permease subunit
VDWHGGNPHVRGQIVNSISSAERLQGVPAGRAETLWSLLLRLWLHLPRRRQSQFGLLLVLMIASAFAEAVTLGAVLPFIAALINPERVLQNGFVAAFARSQGIQSPSELVLPITLTFVSAALIAGAIRVLMLWTSTRIAYATGADLSLEIYRRTLFQPYHVHASRNSSEVISGVVSKVAVVAFVLEQIAGLLSSTVLMTTVMAALLIIDTTLAVTVAVGFGTSYVAISWLFRRRLNHNAAVIARGSTQIVKALQEGLGAIRDVLLDGTQLFYCDIYRRADLPLRRALGMNAFITGSPRFAIEALAMVLIAALAYHVSGTAGGLTAALPVMGALALGGQRLLPALHQCYSSFSIIVGNRGSIRDTLDLLDQPLPPEALLPPPDPIELRESICFEAVCFRYPSSAVGVLEDFNLTIRKGARIGFVGITGSGKSTALDLLMGLTDPTAGRLLVDGEPLTDPRRRRAWQRTIAHVPQSVFLADATLAENIALGVPREEIDMARVRYAARKARIADFIENQPLAYDSMVGERGVRISGGQRQRVAIARALYKEAKVLVFDEATSALDNATESEVMEAIESLDRELTVLIVTHRLLSVRRCDTIVEIAGGRVVASGKYEELLNSSPTFRLMARETA